MPETSQLLVFIAAGWLLNLTPGPDMLYIVSSALRHGLRAGIVAALGILGGCFVHVLATAVGVRGPLATSATAFTALWWVGAACLALGRPRSCCAHLLRLSLPQDGVRQTANPPTWRSCSGAAS